MSRTIVLVRHGKVDLDTKTRIYSNAMQEWVKMYDIAPLCEESKPPDKTHRLVEGANYVISSKLPRSIISAQILGLNVNEQNLLFNELEIPPVKIPFLKFRPKVWLIILRVLVVLRLGESHHAFQASKQRAKKAARYLIEQSDKHEKVVLIGHGGLNWLITKALEQEGWKALLPISHENWGLSVYVKP